MVEDGEAIAIGDGAVSAHLAHALLPRRHLKIVTNSLDAARLLARESTNTVILVGSIVQPSGAVVLDSSSLDSLTRMSVARTFLHARHLSATRGLTEERLEVANTLRALVALADSVIVIADHDSYVTQALVSVVDVSAIDHVILDDHAPAQFVDELRMADVTISLCGHAGVTIPPLRSQETFRVAFANLSETEVFTAEVRQSIENAAKRAGTIELLLADNNYDGETALRNVEQFITQQADLVIEYQTDDSYAQRLLHRLRLAHIPVVAIDIPLPGTTYFGVDNYTAGRIGGEAIVQEVMGRWDGHVDRVLALALPRSGPTVAARMQGQIDAVCESLSIAPEQIMWLDSENVYAMAYRRAREALSTIPSGQRLAVVAINDAVMRGAITALEETGHAGNAVAVSQGADRLALEELQRPGTPLVGAVTFSPETYGDRVIPLALDILTGKKIPPAVYQHHRLIRADVARDYLNASHIAG